MSLRDKPFYIMRYRTLFLVPVIACFGAFVGCKQGNAPSPSKARPTQPTKQSNSSNPSNGKDSNDGNLLLGNATNAGKDADNYLLARPQYTMSYNHSRGGSNWVAWHIDMQDLGSEGRSNNFRPDPDLPRDWQITPTDYRSSGYDRGHVCPSGDRTGSSEDNSATFYMSNMLPQTAELNREVWGDFENALRSIVRQGNEIYVVAGGSGEKERIGGGKVAVPKICWKVALILPAGKNDLSRINAQTRVITVAMPNVADKKLADSDWRQYIVTTKKLSDAIGNSGAMKINFFAALPNDVRQALEAKKDDGN